MSNLGGSLGLYIGMSFVTMFEVLELLLDMIFLACHKIRNHSKVINDALYTESDDRRR